MPPTPKLEKPSAFGEPSEPADICPQDQPRAQLTRPQEENPQAVVKTPAAQDNKHTAKEEASSNQKSDKGRSKL
ncbi:hypothetical protein BV25DRAFT_1819657 [Artomyces pyxidatus]|uniref:Uncharacterized protein n=1 Tax=Artomyces pyxidatus TaxID=48021 RepID=A0ACB8TFX7_9AGAM|nr:hypothetical protein BV25DRAFT_1819657 [Artomyces pyxidatus]